jgi:hypothetical protein
VREAGDFHENDAFIDDKKNGFRLNRRAGLPITSAELTLRNHA